MVRDALTLALGGSGGALLTFLVWLYLARSLPPTDYGALGAAFAWVALFHLVGDVGINYLAIREGSKAPERANQVLRTLAGPKLALLLLSTGACVLLALPLPFRGQEGTLIGVLAVSVPLLGAASYLACILNIRRRMIRLTVVQVSERAANAAFVVTALFIGAGVTGAALAAVASAAVQLGLARLATSRVRGGNLWPPAPLPAARPYLAASAQFGAAALLGVILLRVDVVVVALLSAQGELAAYVAASQMLVLMMLFPAAISQAAFPWIVPRLAKRQISLRSLLVWCGSLCALGAGLATAASLAAPKVFTLLFPAPEIAAGWRSFQVLVWTLVPALGAVPISLALDALDLQSVHVVNATAMAALSVALNLLLVPRMGGMGAAWAAVVAWGFGLFFGVPLAVRYLARHPALSGQKPQVDSPAA